MKIEFDLERIEKVGIEIEGKVFPFTCCYMGFYVNNSTREIYSDLFNFKEHSLNHIISIEDNEIYTYEELFNLRLMLIAMFYEVARRENEGEKIL